MSNACARVVAIVFLAGGLYHPAWARDGREIDIPMRSKPTPVQRLNREGVEAVKKRDFQRAEALFYKAYLYDTADPFTLNNLGYVAEVEGQLDRAQYFYNLASEQGSDAAIDKSNAKHLEGRPMKAALVNLQDLPMRVNRMNINAMRLLAEQRSFEALALLKQTLASDPRNPFTLNNLGVASESIGDFDNALRFYRSAAASNSAEPAIITMDQSWRGKSVSEMAAASARRLERRLRDTGQGEARAITLTVHGVAATNQNDWSTAREDFLRAYSLDPTSAFTLNNRGYVAERDGDLETAQYYYGKARGAENARAKVGLATNVSAQGKDLFSVAVDSNTKVDGALEEYSRQRRRQTGPIELTPRGDTTTAPAPPSPQQQPPQ